MSRLITSQLERSLGTAACAALNHSAAALLDASESPDRLHPRLVGTEGNSGGGGGGGDAEGGSGGAGLSLGETRLGALLAFGALAVLVLVATGTLACACRQRSLRRSHDRARWRLLLSQHTGAMKEAGAKHAGVMPACSLSEPLLASSRPGLQQDSHLPAAAPRHDGVAHAANGLATAQISTGAHISGVPMPLADEAYADRNCMQVASAVARHAASRAARARSGRGRRAPRQQWRAEPSGPERARG